MIRRALTLAREGARGVCLVGLWWHGVAMTLFGAGYGLLSIPFEDLPPPPR